MQKLFNTQGVKTLPDQVVLWNTCPNENTVKTLYNVIRYNRIFNNRHKIAGNGSVSIKIPSL